MSPISGGARYGSGARKTGRPGSGSSGWPTTGSRNRESVIRGQRVASPLDTQGGSRMPESGPYGSVRGARGNSRPYRESDDGRAVKTGLLTYFRFRAWFVPEAGEAFDAGSRKLLRRCVPDRP